MNSLSQIDAFVYLRKKPTAPTKWPIARVVEVHPGQNKMVRVVTDSQGYLQEISSEDSSLRVAVREGGTPGTGYGTYNFRLHCYPL